MPASEEKPLRGAEQVCPGSKSVKELGQQRFSTRDFGHLLQMGRPNQGYRGRSYRVTTLSTAHCQLYIPILFNMIFLALNKPRNCCALWSSWDCPEDVACAVVLAYRYGQQWAIICSACKQQRIQTQCLSIVNAKLTATDQQMAPSPFENITQNWHGQEKH